MREAQAAQCMPVMLRRRRVPVGIVGTLRAGGEIPVSATAASGGPGHVVIFGAQGIDRFITLRYITSSNILRWWSRQMARESLTTLEHALLGLLGMSPGSGYDIHKVFERTPLAHFSSSPGAIYPALKRLARAGLLDEEMDRRAEARPRRVYSLAEEGEGRLEEWLREQVTREELVRKPGASLLRFSLMESRLSKAEVVTYLRGFREAVAAYVAELETYREMAKGGGLHALLALENGIAEYECELEWIDRAMAAVDARGAGHRGRRKRR